MDIFLAENDFKDGYFQSLILGYHVFFTRDPTFVLID